MSQQNTNYSVGQWVHYRIERESPTLDIQHYVYQWQLNKLITV